MSNLILVVLTCFFASVFFTSLFVIILWKIFYTLYSEAWKALRMWETGTPPARSSFYQKMVMFQARKILQQSYKKFPKVGDLLSTRTREKIFIVTFVHVPKNLDPFGYIEIQNMEIGKSNDHKKIKVFEYFPSHYEVISAEENDKNILRK